MIEGLAAWFARPLVKWGAIALVVLSIFGAGVWAYNSIATKNQKIGETLVIDKVQTRTIEAVEKARGEKEKANASVRATPLDAVIDELR